MKNIHTLKQELQKEFPHLEEKQLERFLQELSTTQPTVTIDADVKKQLAQKLQTLGELSSGKTVGIQRFSKKTPWLLGLSGFAFCLGAFALVFSSFNFFDIAKDDRDYSIGAEVLDTTVDVSEKRAEESVIIEAEEIEKVVVTDETIMSEIEEEKDIEAGKGEYMKKSRVREEVNNVPETIQQKQREQVQPPKELEVVPLVAPKEKIIDVGVKTEMIQTRSVEPEKLEEKTEVNAVETTEDTSLSDMFEITGESKGQESLDIQPSRGFQTELYKQALETGECTADEHKKEVVPKTPEENCDAEHTDKAETPTVPTPQMIVPQSIIPTKKDATAIFFKKVCETFGGIYNETTNSCTKEQSICSYEQYKSKSCPFMK